MNKDDFVKHFQNLSLHKDNVISKEAIELVMQYYSDYKKEKLPVIWLETNDSGDNNISFMNTTYPYLDRVFTEMIDLLYSNTFMAAQGKDALDILNNTAKYYAGKFTLVVEGAIPIKDQGLYNVIAVTEQQPLTALKVVTWLGGLAKYVVAIGTCASFGGPSGARPNLTGSTGVKDVLKRQVVNVSGCPVNPDWFVGTLAHLILYGMPDLDELGFLSNSKDRGRLQDPAYQNKLAQCIEKGINRYYSGDSPTRTPEYN
jgi:hydrogenase small subunit